MNYDDFLRGKTTWNSHFKFSKIVSDFGINFMINENSKI